MKEFYFKSKLIILILTLGLITCKKKGELIDITGNCIFYDNILSTCFYGASGSEYDQFVFRNQSDFQNFGNSVRIYPVNLDCDTAKMPYIDFDKYSVVTKRTIGSGCSARYNRTILKDTDNKKIIYKISVLYEGNCRMLLVNRNWAYMPNFPNDWKVEYQVK